MIALITAQGTACAETGLCPFHDATATRERVKAAAGADVEQWITGVVNPEISCVICGAGNGADAAALNRQARATIAALVREPEEACAALGIDSIDEITAPAEIWDAIRQAFPLDPDATQTAADESEGSR